MKVVIEGGCLFKIQVLYWMNEKLVRQNNVYKSSVHHSEYGRQSA